ncbi:MAG: hypothetical protein ACLVBA_12635 [Alistipes finegoldii]|uniref:hypothetical protein n=1 Tax=Alistipes finegoldii TaxID=214856 RepID=UPI0022E2A36D|nr:hypothetical protein [Alistipes finegoldii]
MKELTIFTPAPRRRETFPASGRVRGSVCASNPADRGGKDAQGANTTKDNGL